MHARAVQSIRKSCNREFHDVNNSVVLTFIWLLDLFCRTFVTVNEIFLRILGEGNKIVIKGTFINYISYYSDQLGVS